MVLEKTLEKPFREIPKYKAFRQEVERRRKEGSVRYILIYGGRGSGKSKENAEILTRFMFNNRDRIACFRKNEAQNKDSIYTEIIQHLKTPRADGVKILPNMYRIGKSPKIIETRNRRGKKGSIRFYGLRFAERIKSLYRPDVSVFEEASEFTLEDFLTYDQSLRHEGCLIVLLFNPPHEGKDSWLYKYFLSEEADEEVKKLTLSLHTKYTDNPYISLHAKKIYEALERTNPHEYRRSILGEFLVNPQSLVYPNLTVVSPSFCPPLEAVCLQGLDFGFSDPCAMVRLHYWSEEREYYIFVEKEKYKTHLSTSAMISYLTDWSCVKNYLTHADSSHPAHIKDLQIAGFNVKGVAKGPKSVISGINFCKSCHILVHPRCENFLNEIRNFSWKKDPNGGFRYGVIADSCQRHLMDAMRYALEKEIARNYSKSSISNFM